MKPKIITVKEAPKLAGLFIQQGFRDEQAVLKWALCHGHAEVYYMKSHQRVYVDRSKMLVEKARKAERQSTELVRKVMEAVDAL